VDWHKKLIQDVSFHLFASRENIQATTITIIIEAVQQLIIELQGNNPL
jgi:hypothetical protein